MELPESVELEILSKLPVKSLTRFRCVCKGWSSSFQTSDFITKHYRNNVDNDNLKVLAAGCNDNSFYNVYFSALSTQDGEFVATENIKFPGRGYPSMYGPCNGLFCISFQDKSFAFWNPSTREFKMIPESTVPRPLPRPSSPYPGWREEEWKVCPSFHGYGFGFDSTTHDYKFVRSVTNYIERVDDPYWQPDAYYQVELYSLKSDSWKELTSVPDKFLYGHSLGNNYLNGICYWAISDALLAFDMADEKFLTLPFPCPFLTPFVFNDLLHGFVHEWTGSNYEDTALYFWVMKNDGSNLWTRQLCIESLPSLDGVRKVFGLWKTGEIFLHGKNELLKKTGEIFLQSKNELLLFDPATREVKTLAYGARRTLQVVTYAESLVSINGRSEHEGGILRLPAGEPKWEMK